MEPPDESRATFAFSVHAADNRGAMPPSVPQRHTSTAPERLSPAWRLHRGGRTATCNVWSHLFGFELRLTLPGDPLPRTHVCKSQEELIATQDEWRAALEAHGWRATPAAT